MDLAKLAAALIELAISQLEAENSATVATNNNNANTLSGKTKLPRAGELPAKPGRGREA